jgi:hypothetical protein
MVCWLPHDALSSPGRSARAASRRILLVRWLKEIAARVIHTGDCRPSGGLFRAWRPAGPGGLFVAVGDAVVAVCGWRVAVVIIGAPAAIDGAAATPRVTSTTRANRHQARPACPLGLATRRPATHPRVDGYRRSECDETRAS